MANWLQKKDIMDRSTIDAIAGQVSERHNDLEKSINDLYLKIEKIKSEIINSETSLNDYLNELEEKLVKVDQEFIKKDESLSEVIDSLNVKQSKDIEKVLKSIDDIKRKQTSDIKDIIQVQNITIDDIVSCKNHILSDEVLIKTSINDINNLKSDIITLKEDMMADIDALEVVIASSQIFTKQSIETIIKKQESMKKQAIIAFILTLIIMAIAINI